MTEHLRTTIERIEAICREMDDSDFGELAELAQGVLPYLTPKPRKPDAKRVAEGHYHRASGDTVCGGCGFTYADHDTVRGFPWLTRLCDGRLVKL